MNKELNMKVQQIKVVQVLCAFPVSPELGCLYELIRLYMDLGLSGVPEDCST